MKMVLGSRDLERSAGFYAGLLGYPEVRAARTDGSRTFRAGEVAIEVVHAGTDDNGGWVDDDLQGGIRHFGMRVGDVDTQLARLRAAGVEVLSPPADVLGGVRIAFFLDPDGARLEFVQGTLHYEHVYSADPALSLPAGEGPVFDHVAFTVPDLTEALRYWRDERGFDVLGDLRHHDDPRGFLMTYLRAGPAVLEIFSFDVPTAPAPAPAAVGLRDFSA